MKPNHGRMPWLVLGVVLALLTACAPTGKPREAVLTFDGKTCQYEGPGVTEEGDLTIVLNNQTELDASLWVVRLDEGKTWQDMIDYIGAPGSEVHPPDWSSVSIMKSTLSDNPDATILTLKQGVYAICCCTCGEISGRRGVWPGTSLEVKAK